MKRKVLLPIYLVLLLLISLGTTIYFQFLVPLNTELNLKALDKYLKQESYNGTILISYKGEVIFEKGYGYADKENEVKNTPETAFYLGSITKQFTAASILHLQEAGKLKVADTVHQYYPQFPNGENITIHQLLTHTSGLPEYLDYLENDDTKGREWKTDDIIKAVQDKPAKSQPGEKYEYNNFGYVILGGVIEKVTGERYEQYIKDHILTPIGMSQTDFGYNESTQPVKAIGYMSDKYEVAPFVHPTFSHAGGALSSTLHDLYLWTLALEGNKILSENSKKLMFSQSYTGATLMPGQAYGYGVYVIDEEKMYHPGYIDGFSSNIFRDTETDLVVIGLSNMHDSILPMLPSMLQDFSYRAENSYLGYLVSGLLYVILLWSYIILVKWLVGLYRGTRKLQRARWYRVVFQTVLLQIIGIILFLAPILPGFALDMLFPSRLLFLVAPFWADAVNVLVALFILLTLAALQPFIKKAENISAVTNEKM
ncbi:serine hydrolase domain-containing protein [Cytobacillus sp. FJAT-54145]|uniref:Serine hydrolase domain-containing protein n=1 Tax=Cytobacillus spartinae TaxID=3299023 RepID=A0ABW6KHE5_9BACI